MISTPGAPQVDAARLAAALVRPGGVWTQVTTLATTGSTNADLAAAARAGAESGTVLVRDINPGAAGSYHTAFTVYTGEQPGFTAIDGALYFLANDGVHGYELWKSDGTTAGTVMVKDILPGVSGSSPYGFARVNGTFLFSANNGVNGVELWSTDGTDAGTVLVKDINLTINPTGSSHPYLGWVD